MGTHPFQRQWFASPFVCVPFCALAGRSMAGARFVNAAVSYDVLEDFTPVSTIETAPFVLVANPALQALDLKAFITHARAHPGRLTFGTIGAGQTPWWAAHLFKCMAGIQAVEVTYKEFGSAMSDLIGGRLDYFVAPLVGAIGVRDKVRLLAVTSDRSALLPDVPAIAEAGLPSYDMPAWRSIMGPAGLPPTVVAALNQAIQAIQEALAVPDLRKRYQDWLQKKKGDEKRGRKKRGRTPFLFEKRGRTPFLFNLQRYRNCGREPDRKGKRPLFSAQWFWLQWFASPFMPSTTPMAAAS